MQKKYILSTLCVILLIGVFFFVWKAYTPQRISGEKTLSVSITHADGRIVEKKLITETETLWDAMREANLIDGTDGKYGKWVTTVDGETAKENEQQYWMYTRAGEWVETACDKTFIADGESYEFFVYFSD